MGESRWPSPTAFFSNLRNSDLPWPRRLAVALSNFWRKCHLVQTCCGHPGHPGC